YASSGPYLPNMSAFSLAAPDRLGRYHIINPLTEGVLCSGGLGRVSRKFIDCKKLGGLYFGRARNACEVPYDKRCFDIFCWPRYVPKPDGPWPEVWHDDRPPDW